MIKSFIKIILSAIYWNIYGNFIRNPRLPSQVKSILFVCKGNICRSPFAERYASKNFSSSNSLSYYSVGIKVEYPKPPPVEAIVSARNFGIDLHDHQSRVINYRLMEEFDLIIAMETWQHQYLIRNFRSFKNKIFLLPLFKKQEVVPDSYYSIYNIRDPYGKNVAEFDKCFRDINNCLDGLFSEINKAND